MGANSSGERKPIFVLMAMLGAARGVARINELPGCWECAVDEHWWFAMNGHDKPMMAHSPTGASSAGAGVSVEPFHAYVEFNGFPAGVLNPYGGVFAAGEAANEDTFLAALEMAIAKTRREVPR